MVHRLSTKSVTHNLMLSHQILSNTIYNKSTRNMMSWYS